MYEHEQRELQLSAVGRTSSLCPDYRDTVSGVRRLITDYPIEVIIEAAGENLRQYIYLNDSTIGIAASDSEFLLIDGGYGVFSSKMTISRPIRLGGETVPELLEMTHWGFKFIGGKETISTD